MRLRTAVIGCWTVHFWATVPAVVLAQPLEAESVLVRLVDEVDVPARAAGVLVKLNIAKGDAVQEGQLLATVDDTEAQLLVQRAEKELELAQRKAKLDVAIRLAERNQLYALTEYRRFQQAEKGRPRSISESELEEKLLQLDQAKLDLERGRNELQLDGIIARSKQNELEIAKHNVALRQIVAPLNGIVVEVVHEAGEWVEPGEKVLRIVRVDRLHAEGFVKASEIKGDLTRAPVSLSIQLSDASPTSFSGKLIFVSPEIDPVTSQVRVCAEIDNRQGRLRPGIRGRMTIDPN